MQNNGVEIEGFDSKKFASTNELNLFELVIGFGKLLTEKFPVLFSYDSDPMKIESIGFNLINACLSQKNNQIKKLSDNLRTLLTTEEKINEFLIKIIECTEYIDNRLKRVTGFKGNSRNIQNLDILHTELQITSLIAFVFSKKYTTITLDEKENVKNIEIHLDSNSKVWSKNKESFDNNMIKRYIIDILQQNWRGSGDKKLDTIILTNKEYYTREIEWEEMNQNLNIWFDKINNERNEYIKVSQPKEAEKTILKLVYSGIFKAKDHLNETKYDIEHLATKSQMKKHLEKFNGELRLPISSIGNLCYLLEFDNRTKRDKTIYQDRKYLDSINLHLVESDFTFTIKDDLDWIDKEYQTKEELKADYMNFLNKRFEKIKIHIKNNLYKN